VNRQIRIETAGDIAAVFDVNVAAFPTRAEARLVDVLRESAKEHMSLVALENHEIVGHIMFTPVTLESYDEARLMGLAPMAVSPAAQRAGIGTELVRAGLQQCRESGAGAIAVLGHPEFYPRFGFRPASQWRISSEYGVPEEVFMMMELKPGYLRNYHGVIRYDPASADV